MSAGASDDSILKRIRSRVTGSRSDAVRTVAPPGDEADLRDAVRLVARSRVSQTLSQLRAARGLSYEQVRQQSGLSMQLLYDLEYRDRRLTLDELRRLAGCYEVSVNDILGIDLDP